MFFRFISPVDNSISKLLHLPVYLTQNYHYFIKLTYDNNTFYSFLSLKESNLQCPSISYQYDYINTERTLTTFSAKTFDNSDQLYISTNTLEKKNIIENHIKNTTKANYYEIMVIENKEGMAVRAQSKTSLREYTLKGSNELRILNHLQRSANIYNLLTKFQIDNHFE